jgi:cyclic pyranopterin phosphate synthase
MEEKMQFLPRAQLLTLEENLQVLSAFVGMGVSKLRITGGEPLVRRNVMWLFERLGELSGVHDLTLTTNGSQLEKMATRLAAAWVSRINISLDSLQPDRFKRLTRTGDLDKVLRGIDAALAAGFKRVKLNAVLLRGRNDDEAGALVQFAVERGMDISFIEEMPLGLNSDHDRAEVFYSSDDLRSDLQRQFELLPSSHSSGGPARYWQVVGSDTRIGFISPHSHNFCASCNRVRVTTEGCLLLCLGHEHSVDLRRVMRANPGDPQALRDAIVDAMALKPERHEFQIGGEPVLLRHMNTTGG